MKYLRKITGAALALTMAMSLTLPALAATYDVETSAQVIEAVEGKSNAAGDRTVILNMKNDITMESPIETVKDWTYTFKGNGNSLKNVTVTGTGTTNIQADIRNAGDGDALTVQDEAVVTVTGDISSQGMDTHAVDAEGNSEVKVSGDISTEGDYSTAVAASENSAVTVTGDISTESTDAARPSWGVKATGNSTVTVTGDISAVGENSTAVTGFQNAAVTVTGDVTAADSGSYAVVGSYDSVITVNGNLKGDLAGAWAQEGTNMTIQGDITGNTIGAYIVSIEDTHTSLTVNGDIQAEGPALMAGTSGNSSNTVKITGNLKSNSQSEIVAQDHSQNQVTVTGNSEGGYHISEAGENPQIKLTHKGDITSETNDAISVHNDSNEGKTTLDLEGTVSTGDPENKGICVRGRSEDASIDISLDGKLNGVVWRYDYVQENIPLNIVYREPEQGRITVPERTLSAVFTAEDLEGRTVSSVDDMVLIYFDPADPESLEALRKGQETASQGETVYAVCLTEDYVGARALMEKAGADYPVLKYSDSLRAILTAHGGMTPLTIEVLGGEFQAPARETTGTVYVPKDLEVLRVRPSVLSYAGD